MKRSFLLTAVGWGIGLWLIGYILGFVLFFFVPVNLLGWVVTPIGIVVTLWVLLVRIKDIKIRDYFWLGSIWMIIAIIFDYLFIVQLLKPVDGYYKPDVYLYYLLTFLIPVGVGYYKNRRQ